MWTLRIYDRSSDLSLDIKTFKTMFELCNYLKCNTIIFLDASLIIDFMEV